MTAPDNSEFVFHEDGFEAGAASGVLEDRPGDRLFTLEQANKALSFVSRVVDDVVTSYARLRELRTEMESAPAADRRADVEREYEQTMERLSGYVDELHLAGVELKDFERGLVDFPAMHEGREVYLCWQRGEKTIVAWHEIDTGFAGRRDVSELTAS